MALTRKIIEAYVRGESLPDEVVQELDRALDDPDSEVSRMSRERSRLTRLMFDPQGPVIGPDEAEFKELLSVDIRAANELLKERRVEDATALFRGVYDRARDAWGEEHRDTATYLNGLAGLYYRAGDYSAAQRTYEQAVELRSRVMGAGHTDTAISLTGLARVREVEGRYREAVLLHRQAVNVFEAQLGSEHPETAMNLNELGCALHAIGELAEARISFERALAIVEASEGPASLDVGIISGNIGGVLESLGQAIDATIAFQRSLDVIEALADVDEATVRWARLNRGAIASLNGDYATAEPLLQVSAYAPASTDISEIVVKACAWNNYAVLNDATGNHFLACKFFLEAEYYGRSIWPANHPAMRAILRNLSRLPDVPHFTDVLNAKRSEWEAVIDAEKEAAPLTPASFAQRVWFAACEGRSYPMLLMKAA